MVFSCLLPLASVAGQDAGSTTPDSDEAPVMTAPDEAGFASAIELALADLDALDRCPASRDEGATDLRLQKLRTLYILAVEDEDRIDPARSELDRLRNSTWGQGSSGRRTLDAYEGALETLEARHGFWPHARLRHLRAGTSTLDAAVRDDPRGVEPRYLRLVSTAFLPRFLGQSGTVDEDLGALALLLPDAVPHFPRRTFEAMARTVLDLLHEEDPVRPDLERAVREARQLDRPLAPGCSAA